MSDNPNAAAKQMLLTPFNIVCGIILIVGAIRRNGDAVALSYKAVSVEDGTMFAATLPRQIDVATF